MNTKVFQSDFRQFLENVEDLPDQEGFGLLGQRRRKVAVGSLRRGDEGFELEPIVGQFL